MRGGIAFNGMNLPPAFAANKIIFSPLRIERLPRVVKK